MGFQQSTADLTFYTSKRESSFVIMVAFVDDILLFSDKDESLQEVAKIFRDTFKMRVWNKIEKFLPFSVVDDGNQVRLQNALMTTRLLELL